MFRHPNVIGSYIIILNLVNAGQQFK